MASSFTLVAVRAGTLCYGCGPLAGSVRAGQRAAVIMSLMQSAKLNGHDPYGYRFGEG
jgi:hypothetical protein